MLQIHGKGNAEAAASRSFDDSLRYRLNGSKMAIHHYTYTQNFSPLAASPGTTTEIDWKPDSTKTPARRYDDLRVYFTLTNAHATNTATVLNPFGLFSSIRFWINGSEITQQLDAEMVMARASEYYARHNPSHTDLVSTIRRSGANMAQDLTVTAAALGGTAHVEFSLWPLLEIEKIHNVVGIHGIRNIKVALTFKPSTTLTADHQAVASSTATAVYSSLTFADIGLREESHDVLDTRLIRNVSTRIYSPRMAIIRRTFDGSANYTFKLDELASQNSINELRFWVVPALTTANAADGGYQYSGPAHLSFSWAKINAPETRIDLTTDAAKNRRYHDLFYRWRFGNNPYDALIYGDNAAHAETGVVPDDVLNRWAGAQLSFIPLHLESMAGVVTNEDAISPILYGGPGNNQSFSDNWEFTIAKAPGRANFPANSTLVICAVTQEEIAVPPPSNGQVGIPTTVPAV